MARRNIVFFNDKVCGLKEAFQALKVGQINSAAKMSVRNADDCPSAAKVKQKQIAHAHYNVGALALESREKYAHLEQLTEANAFRAETKVLQAAARKQENSVEAQLERLKELLSKGLISQDIYDIQASQILSKALESSD